MKSVLFNFLLLSIVFNGAAQSGSSNRLPERAIREKPDSVSDRYKDSLAFSLRPGNPVSGGLPVYSPDDSYLYTLQQHPYYNFFATPRQALKAGHAHKGKDGLFYLFVGLLLYFACIRLIFGKYLYNLFAAFFRVSLKQKQIREQLIQSPLPSLLLNVFFTIAGGIFISLLLQHYHYLDNVNIWYLMLYSTLALCVLYLLKFLILKLMGWIFSITEATDTYIFAVFLVNKLLGIFLLPFIILIAFSESYLVSALITSSFAMITIFFAYRYIISYAPVRKEIKVSQFHFFLYLCGFEVMPLLLIYKVLITYLERST